MRGHKLDRILEELLAEMLAKGDEISRPLIQKKLGLSSRSTLSGKRADLIEKCREKQLHEWDASDSKYHRLSLHERCKVLTQEKKELESIVDELTEKLQKIILNTEKYGLSPEQVLEPLTPKRRR